MHKVIYVIGGEVVIFGGGKVIDDLGIVSSSWLWPAVVAAGVCLIVGAFVHNRWQRCAASSAEPESLPADPHAAFREAEARWLHQPGVGREAARLIMMAPTIEEAQAVHDTYRAAEKRLDASWAHYAFLYRMEMQGRSDEVMALAAEIAEETGDDFIIDDEDEGWKELQSLYKGVKR